MRSSSQKFFLLLIGTLAVVGLIFKFRNSVTLEGFRWDVLIASLRQTRFSFLLLSFVAVYTCYALRAARWVLFSRSLGCVSFNGVFAATLMGFTCLFLFGRAGEPIRPILIARRENLSTAGMFGVYVLERVMDAAAAVVLAGFALIAFPRGGFSSAKNKPLLTVAQTTGATLLIGLVFMVVFLVYFRLHGAGALEKRLEHTRKGSGWRVKLSVFINDFGKGLQGIRTSADLAASIFYTMAHWLLVALCYLWVAWSFGGKLGSLTLSGAMLVLSFTLVGSALQLPGVGGGAQVATFLVFTVVFGVEREPAAAASILTWLIAYAGVSLVGLPLLLREGLSMRDLRRLTRAENEAEALGGHIAPEKDPVQPGKMRRRRVSGV